MSLASNCNSRHRQHGISGAVYRLPHWQRHSLKTTPSLASSCLARQCLDSQFTLSSSPKDAASFLLMFAAELFFLLLYCKFIQTFKNQNLRLLLVRKWTSLDSLHQLILQWKATNKMFSSSLKCIETKHFFSNILVAPVEENTSFLMTQWCSQSDPISSDEH